MLPQEQQTLILWFFKPSGNNEPPPRRHWTRGYSLIICYFCKSCILILILLVSCKTRVHSRLEKKTGSWPHGPVKLCHVHGDGCALPTANVAFWLQWQLPDCQGPPGACVVTGLLPSLMCLWCVTHFVYVCTRASQLPCGVFVQGCVCKLV